MPLGSLPRATVLRGVAVVAVTAAVTLAAACSDEDTVDTIPPPWPGSTTSVTTTEGTTREGTTTQTGTTATTTTATTTPPPTTTGQPSTPAPTSTLLD